MSALLSPAAFDAAPMWTVFAGRMPRRLKRKVAWFLADAPDATPEDLDEQLAARGFKFEGFPVRDDERAQRGATDHDAQIEHLRAGGLLCKVPDPNYPDGRYYFLMAVRRAPRQPRRAEPRPLPDPFAELTQSERGVLLHALDEVAHADDGDDEVVPGARSLWERLDSYVASADAVRGRR